MDDTVETRGGIPVAGSDAGAPEAVPVGGGEPGSDDLVETPEVVALLPLRDTVVYPEIVAPVMVGRPKSKHLIEDVLGGGDDEKLLAVVALRDSSVEEPTSADLHDVGTLARVIQMFRFPDGSLRVVIEGVGRIRIDEVVETEPYFRARVARLETTGAEGPRVEATRRSVLTAFQRMVELAPYLPEQLVTAALNVTDPEVLADFLASNINMDTEKRQELLATADVADRLEEILRILARELELLEMGSKINEQVQGELDQQQREFLLRRQLDAIRKELGEDDETAEVADLRAQVEGSVMPQEARDEALRELKRLEKVPPASPEHSVIRSYLDWLLAVPWGVVTEDSGDVAGAREILDEDHYGLEKPKERILEFLAVRQLKSDLAGPILCFVGPPGVGKTSLGQSIARALGREFVRMSLGGVRDEAELRGHRRTYIGAMPGRIVAALRRAGSMNPVMMLDEIDKLGADYRGDPAAALLEVLDPAQNHGFRDHYLDVPLDLSRVLFIATANVLDTIPRPLLDRLEVITLPGYTEPEKAAIAERYLVPKELEAHGVTGEQAELTPEAVKLTIHAYTREAGVRSLDRELAALVRKAAREIVEGADTPIRIDEEKVGEYLGPEKFKADLAAEADEVGMATGLAVTAAGGDVLFVEASVVPGTGKLTLTGQLGDVMQESARAALTYARRIGDRLGLDANWADTHDVHVHVPAGAVPKDGPSAGITMATALVSALSDRAVRRSVGMTGEITLRGRVLPIGGVKEKVLAAHRAGLKTVILPEDNAKDVVDVPEFVRDEIDLVFAAHVDEVLALALVDDSLP